LAVIAYAIFHAVIANTALRSATSDRYSRCETPLAASAVGRMLRGFGCGLLL
jgi:hypothetical protein